MRKQSPPYMNELKETLIRIKKDDKNIDEESKIERKRFDYLSECDEFKENISPVVRSKSASTPLTESTEKLKILENSILNSCDDESSSQQTIQEINQNLNFFPSKVNIQQNNPNGFFEKFKHVIDTEDPLDESYQVIWDFDAFENLSRTSSSSFNFLESESDDEAFLREIRELRFDSQSIEVKDDKKLALNIHYQEAEDDPYHFIPKIIQYKSAEKDDDLKNIELRMYFDFFKHKNLVHDSQIDLYAKKP
ncbi:unnamed protein product [Brachionus calyciflorus]|uniref:Uncharacterized protein n=1 Tax=Brachionus calyciflorus TaxID=104777 RepID=A0A813USS4_9BILA|nr:unnamed protein product [Brachionus calyciflorus]